jgi:Ser/Thr protein kinase RdoA (MazF antagonist)
VTDAALVGRLLDEYHERSVAPADIAVVAGSQHETRVTYRLTLPDGSQQIMRAFRADQLVPLHGRGTGSETLADWLLGRGRTLACLAESHYPAPRPVRTRTGELVGVAGQWLTWATSYVPGEELRPTISQLRALGVTMGALHETFTGPCAVGALSLASRHPAVAVPAAIRRLDAVRDRVPSQWQPMYESFRETLSAVVRAAASVPETVVHGDVWARNAVQVAPSGPVTLIDWETAGLGLAVLDLGNCVLECPLASSLPDDKPEEWLITPDEAPIAAVCEGYRNVRELTAAERDLLPEAVRFPAAVLGAVHFELALVSGVTGPTMDARLAVLQNRLDVADVVTALALRHLAG